MRICLDFEPKKIARFTLLGLLITAVWVAALFLADYVATNDMAQNLTQQFGYVGILVVAIVSGLNVLVPVPAAAFVPVFTAAGFTIWLIIAVLVIGTTIADLIGYWLGRWSKEFVEDHYPKTFRRMKVLDERNHNLVLPIVFVYAALLPFPNEAIIIPLALIGFKFRTFLIPLVLGNIVNQTALAFGASNIFSLLFGF